MYCSSCGVVVAQSLSYCNHCGAKLNRGDSVIKSPEVKPDLLVSAMAGVFILGLAAITVLMGVMKTVLELNVGQVLAFALLPFLIMLALEGVFLRLLLRGRRGNQEVGDTVLLKGHATKELDVAHAGVLREPVSSVTDHTTRTLEPVHNKRTSE